MGEGVLSLVRRSKKGGNGHAPGLLDCSIAGQVASAAVSYTNGGVVTPDGEVHVWGGEALSIALQCQPLFANCKCYVYLIFVVAQKMVPFC